MHYYQHNIGDYARDTAHLSVIEHGIYRLLLDWCYLNEQPITTEKALRISRGYPVETQSVLSEFFMGSDDGWIHKRVVKEIQAYHEKAEKNRKNGSKGGRPVSQNNPVGSQSHPNRNLNQEPITNNQEPCSVPKGTGDKPPLTPDEIIFGYGVPLLTNAGTADKQARSFLGGLRRTHGDQALINSLRECIRAGPLQPLEWLAKALPPKGGKKPNKQEELEARNKAVGAAWLAKMEANDAQA